MLLPTDENDPDSVHLHAAEADPLLGPHTMAEPAQDPSRLETAPDAGVARRVLKKIDRAIIPLLFVTYMLNFMDKIILSSAAVFGLRDDTVRSFLAGTS